MMYRLLKYFYKKISPEYLQKVFVGPDLTRSKLLTIKVSSSLDPDQTLHFAKTDLGPNCLQRSHKGRKKALR